MSQREIVDNEGRYEECIAGTLTATSQWEVVIEPLCAKQKGLDLLAAACPSKGPHVILVLLAERCSTLSPMDILKMLDELRA